MPDRLYYEVLILLTSFFLGAALALICVLVGAWVMFKGKSTQPETFLGKQPKGEAFTIDADETEEFPGAEESSAEEHILKKTGEFLKTLSGGKE